MIIIEWVLDYIDISQITSAVKTYKYNLSYLFKHTL